jgi:hypothetical protein
MSDELNAETSNEQGGDSHAINKHPLFQQKARDNG